jgi:hypothetical protein
MEQGSGRQSFTWESEGARLAVWAGVEASGAELVSEDQEGVAREAAERGFSVEGMFVAVTLSESGWPSDASCRSLLATSST